MSYRYQPIPEEHRRTPEDRWAAEEQDIIQARYIAYMQGVSSISELNQREKDRADLIIYSNAPFFNDPEWKHHQQRIWDQWTALRGAGPSKNRNPARY